MAATLPDTAIVDLPETTDGSPLDADDLVAAWERLSGTGGTPAVSGSADDFGMGSTDSDDDAGFLGFDPRTLVRAATMWRMTDRAGVVGRTGVAEVLGRLLSQSSARAHLIGHSYGCKVISTALSETTATRKAQSLTLFQPAVNHLAFAPEARPGKAGAYCINFNRLVRPVFSAYSQHDTPLHRMFHLAARRKKDIGELQFAARTGRYYALGGYGPLTYAQGEVQEFQLPQAGAFYPHHAASGRLIGLDGAEGITGHSDVDNPYTHWAMMQQLT
ncbi:hypothetical protein HW561_19825 [Rhodobacteraceae bacterium B1Z28]|uniref:Alpha/beta hydrolase family protein DUF900 n=1 Tax=Ruegeria haliotis TaxID=2747601 RepID=A0ABX2PWA1_9RHOB|nr:hypothetical protein [Ruegeria haliotis]NVO58049.1 hypothetical protein [Ruegeria haliotis]